MTRFVIPGRLSSMNDIIREARYNRFAAAAQKKKQMAEIMFWINAAHLLPIRNPVKVRFIWIESNNKRDIDNVVAGGVKPILDSLVELGILPGDTRRWVKAIEHQFPEPEKSKARIIVELEEIK